MGLSPHSASSILQGRGYANERPEIAFYNAGTDIYEDDPLGRLKISAEGILARDLFVFQTLVDARIPVVMVLSGGYTSESYQLVAGSVGEVWETWDL